MTIAVTNLPVLHIEQPRGATLVGRIYDYFAGVAERHEAKSAEALRAYEAEQVRRYAREIENQDPGFAADLFAAANRHEGQ